MVKSYGQAANPTSDKRLSIIGNSIHTQEVLEACRPGVATVCLLLPPPSLAWLRIETIVDYHG